LVTLFNSFISKKYLKDWARTVAYQKHA